MNKLIRFIQTYLIVGFPFVLACIVWSNIRSQNNTLQETALLAKLLWHALGLNILLWFSVLILFLGLLVAVPSVRENTLKRLANIKERDEREEYITGKAARSTYISSLSLIIFLLFFSLFSFKIYRLPQNKTIHQHHRADISIGFSLFNQSSPVKNTPQDDVFFDSKNFSLSPSAIILILLSWHLLIFNLAARKEKNK